MSNTLLSGAKDPLVQPGPRDTVQSLKFSPRGSFLAACDWDGKTSIWEVSSTLQTIPKSQIAQETPVLSVSWQSDGSRLFSGGTDNQVKVWDLISNAVSTVGIHRAPVRSVAWSEDLQHIVSGSWDSSISFWDCRQQNPTAQASLKGRVFDMSLQYPLLVCILSDRQIALWDLRLLRQGKYTPEYVPESTIKYQIRSVACSPDTKLLALGLMEGRAMLKKVVLGPVLRVETDFAFKCHRDQQVHSVNVMAFCRPYGNLITAGSDGQISIWDKEKRQRVRGYVELGGPVTALDVQTDSNVMAYAVGYDWQKGVEFAGSVPAKIALRNIASESRLGPG